MRPVIGITAGTKGVPVAEGTLPSHYTGIGYVRAVWDAGGTPLLLPAVAGAEREMAEAAVNALDGLVLAGGTDIDPASYGVDERSDELQPPDRSRDAFEMHLLDLAENRALPVLGICRGFQMLNVWAGGTLSQHMPHTTSTAMNMDGLRVETTKVALEPNSAIGRMFAEPALEVRCLHHQAVDKVGPGLRVVGSSADGLVEALERVDRDFMVGLLWHPEQMLESKESIKPYQALVEASVRRGG